MMFSMKHGGGAKGRGRAWAGLQPDWVRKRMGTYVVYIWGPWKRFDAATLNDASVRGLSEVS